MGIIILKNNGYTTKIVNGIPFSAITEEPNTNYLGFDPITNNLESFNPSGVTTTFGEGGGSTFTGGTISGQTFFPSGLTASTISATTYENLPCNVESVTYFELTSKITGSTLCEGKYYLISDFQTCYDVPEYYVNGNPKGSNVIDYRQSNVDPIIVLATSVNTISSTAYQPSYPNDRIQYDWTFNLTPNTGGVAYGRITERIDEFNNRTDYDHRTIYFNRFMSYNKGSQLTGEIKSYNSASGIMSGNDTSFLGEVEIGDVLLIDYDGQVGVKVVSAITDTELIVVVDEFFGNQINFTDNLIPFYLSTPTGNYYEYKEVYVGQKNEEDWNDYLTFNLDGSAIHNYVGDYSKFYLDEIGTNSGFLLANNVFYGNKSYSNTIGDRSYNNTGTYWFARNTIAGRFYNNVIHNNGFYSNSIGEYFYNNIIKGYMYENTIRQYFESNTIYRNFNNNQIGNGLNNNVIYSDFYDNQIGNYFNSNTIGDNGNLGNFEFYRNRIGNNFEYNTIRQYFQNNQIGNQFADNTANGNFYKNAIGNGFNYNQNIGHDFYGNHIGNGFNNNELIGDYFKENKIGEKFYSNSISYLFNNNQIGNIFENNTLGDTQYFNWDNTNIGNLTARTYNTFYNSLYGDDGVNNLGSVILGKELIMHFYRDSGTTQSIGNLVIGETYEITNVAFGGGDFSNVADVINGTINTTGCTFIATGTTPTSWCGITVTELTVYNEYHKVKFYQWTQNQNGGGFSYERTKVYPTSEPTVYFTKLNYEDIIDIVVPSRLEIARGNQGAIYNEVTENSWNQNVSPEGTEWNSIYTQPYNGHSFEDNTIVNQFKGNYIRGDFQINSISSYVAGNHFSGNTYSNIIGDYTFDNDFLGEVAGNTLIGDFNNNTIGDDLDKNTFESGFAFNVVLGFMEGNKIGLNTYSNIFSGGTLTGNDWKGDFYDNTIDGSFDGNTIGFTFHDNTIVGNVQGNIFGYQIYDNTITTLFTGNTIGNEFYNNEFSGETIENIIGDLCYENQIFNLFEGNNISYGFKGNLILEPFAFNNVGLGFTANQISGQTIFNTFGDATAGNNFLGNFISNKISNFFVENSVGNDFSLNTIGESFGFNIIGNSFGANTIGIGFQDNTIGNEFESNYIGDIFEGNTIGDHFGYGAVSSQKNIIGDNFINNIIGEHFYNNKISNNFNLNIVDNYFQWNIVDTLINDTCLTSPVLYEPVTVNVFKNRNLDDRLSYYDELDVLTIETLTEAPCNDITPLDIPENDLNFGLIL
jgi:hypothetical protein